MQKQFLIAIVLSFLVIYGWQALFPPPRPTPAPPAVTSTDTAAGGGTASSVGAAQTPPGTPPAVEAPAIEAGPEKDIQVENEHVRAVFSTKGAVLKSWQLKDYKDAAGHWMAM